MPMRPVSSSTRATSVNVPPISTPIRHAIANPSLLDAGSCYRREHRSTSRGQPMDLKAVREEAIEATTRAFWDRSGFVPDEDSEEWEEEYRRQFEQAKRRYATGHPAEVKPSVAAVPKDEEGWAVLTGAPT